MLSGLLYMFLEIRQHRAMWIVGFLTSFVYVFVFFFSKIYADMGLNIYYVVISVYGFWQWTQGKEGKEDAAATATRDEIIYRNLTPRLLGVVMLAIAALFASLYNLLHRFTDSPIPVGDAFTTAVGIVATWMLARRFIEHWVFWIVVNCVSVWLYCWLLREPPLPLPLRALTFPAVRIPRSHPSGLHCASWQFCLSHR